VVAGTYGGRAVLVDTRTKRAIARIKTGRYPVAIAG
jgi:hypothetical protein